VRAHWSGDRQRTRFDDQAVLSEGVLYPIVILLIFANTFNVGADLAAIAAGINLLVPIPIITLIPPIAIGLILLQIFAKYQMINRVFKWLCIALLAYVATAFVSHANVADVAKGTLIPKLPRTKDDITLMIAILGTTISPISSSGRQGRR
jgi:Mn2+/Fe2+ NRAMP family transporter